MPDTAAAIPQPVIELRSVHKRFGDDVAVQDTSFTIAPGEFFSMLGPSGCGKTTTLRMIAGFEQPTSGAILLEGADVSAVPPFRRNVNTVFQHYALFPHMTVWDNVAFGPRSQKVSRSEVASRVEEFLGVVRLEEYAHRKPAQLSGGQQQRVALARALACSPAALLLDEPLGALDLKLRQTMQAELKRIQREIGITFVYVTHDQEEALTMSDRIAVMNEGRVEQIAAPTEIYDDPASVFVAGFIGDANLLSSTLEGGGAATSAGFIEVPVLGGWMPSRPPSQVAAGQVTVMVRPDRIVLSAERPDAPSIEVTITDVVFQGSTVKLTARGANGESIFAHPQRTDLAEMPLPGDCSHWSWDGSAARILMGGQPSSAD